MDQSREQHRTSAVDEPRENRPGVPMSGQAPTKARGQGPLPRQQPRQRQFHSPQFDELTPVFGTGPAPRWASGALRAVAYRIPEHQARRWLLLLAADRVDVLEHRVPELLTGRGWGALADQVRANPVGMLGLAVGVGFMLERTRVVDTLGGALASAVGAALRGGTSSRKHDPEERLLAWLEDAYAMELAQLPILQNHADDARRLPEVRKRDLKHLEETRQHVKDVRRCIERLGAEPSASKQAIGRITGAMTSMASEPFDDEVVKNFLTDYATEHFEIACYRSLIEAAEEADYPDIARVCREILEEEEAMAAWLEDKLPIAVKETLR
jgi:ferritin-like metal-binding protein YciE